MALFDWQENAGVGCPSGYVWSPKHQRCIPKRFEAQEGAGWSTQLGTAIGNIGQEIGSWGGVCRQGYWWDYDLGKCVPIPTDTATTVDLTQPEDYTGDSTTIVDTTTTDNAGDSTTTIVPDDYWHPENIIPDEPIVPETPPGLFGDTEGVFNYLNDLLTTEASQETENKYWQVKMDRLNEQYEKQKDQLMEDLNVRGLYYAGARGDKLEELSDDFNKIVAEEEAKFQYERWNREVQRATLATQWALGTQAQNIEWALGKGQLTLQQLDLALQEALGVRALDLQDKGMMLDFMTSLYYVSIAQQQTDIQKQTAWANIVSILYQMGVTEQEIANMWAKISGQQTTPPV